jgi:hypothetical protein
MAWLLQTAASRLYMNVESANPESTHEMNLNEKSVFPGFCAIQADGIDIIPAPHGTSAEKTSSA